MSAAAALARAQAAGLRLRLRPDGGLRVEADAPPPAELLDELRRWRDEIALLLAAQDIPSDAGGLVGDDDDPERQAMAAYYGGELSAPSYLPSDRDQLRDGLLAGFGLARHAATAQGRGGRDVIPPLPARVLNAPQRYAGGEGAAFRLR
jgi:hypothetical protein